MCGEEHHELVAPQTGHRVSSCQHDPAESRGDLFQYLITVGVPQGVVYLFETIEIEH